MKPFTDVVAILDAHAGVLAALSLLVAIVAAAGTVAAVRWARRSVQLQANRHHIDLTPTLNPTYEDDPKTGNPLIRLTNRGPVNLATIRVMIQPPSNPTTPPATIVVTDEGRVASTVLGPLGVGESFTFCVYLESTTPRAVRLAFVSTAPGFEPWSTFAEVQVDHYNVLDSIY
ncbi:MAG TPA: hypothetical protein VF049_04975 [Nocardioidaceae bacterium]